ncbi:NAD-dependent DNA ligase LigA [Taibaiella soli]|uniref:DNA ligase n=1 Tax=Taibaiella soli TaxID=1649169 RepID=A0A2W2B227_9BACT|nr:NAD-dependent DNA ligase LigA [Taibaiella soli]PZF74078.1 DNA ligase (NAD(+)) LigA [Taibaiella soli]
MYTKQDEQQLYKQAKDLLALTAVNDPAATIDQLKTIINFADWKYYVQDEPVLADIEYDQLFKQLKHLEGAFPELLTEDSPTQRIAQGISERFPTVAHLVPMLSLDNTYNADDLSDWDRRCRELAGTDKIEYCVEPKYDGASISLIYENGKLVRGATRGDGVMGEEITTNIRQIKSIPLAADFLKDGVGQIEIRGEVVIHKETFAAFNQQRTAEGLAPLANPRNAASGTLRMLDPEEVRKRRLSAVLYHISYYTQQGEKPEALNTHFGSLQWLYSLGFPTPVKEMKRFGSIDEVIEFCHAFEERRDDLPYEVDGLVIKVNSFDMQDKMGMTTHHPRWAVAFKFKARQATSKLRRVEFQVGRTGSVTPVAKIDPVPIGGVTVSSISLFNEDVVREKDLHIGDTVLVERAGDVIPYIVKPLAELRDGTETEIEFPKNCPVCGEALEKPQGEAVWRCINISCPAQVVERIMHFASKDAMDIRSLGGANVLRFYENKIVTDIPGIYHINWDEVKGWEGFGAKSVSNLKQAIENSKQQPLNRLIYGLGIRHVGETMAKTLANAVGHIKELYDWTEEQLIALEDVGPKVAASVAHFFHAHENRHMLDLLEKEGVNLANQLKGHAGVEGELSGKTFLFTGTLSHFKRSDAEVMVEAKGGAILGGVSSKLNYLVVGEDAGSKLEKAKKLGTVNILTEEEFLALIQS